MQDLVQEVIKDIEEQIAIKNVKNISIDTDVSIISLFNRLLEQNKIGTLLRIMNNNLLNALQNDSRIDIFDLREFYENFIKIFPEDGQLKVRLRAVYGQKSKNYSTGINALMDQIFEHYSKGEPFDILEYIEKNEISQDDLYFIISNPQKFRRYLEVSNGSIKDYVSNFLGKLSSLFPNATNLILQITVILNAYTYKKTVMNTGVKISNALQLLSLTLTDFLNYLRDTLSISDLNLFYGMVNNFVDTFAKLNVKVVIVDTCDNVANFITTCPSQTKANLATLIVNKIGITSSSELENQEIVKFEGLYNNDMWHIVRLLSEKKVDLQKAYDKEDDNLNLVLYTSKKNFIDECILHLLQGRLCSFLEESFNNKESILYKEISGIIVFNRTPLLSLVQDLLNLLNSKKYANVKNTGWYTGIDVSSVENKNSNDNTSVTNIVIEEVDEKDEVPPPPSDFVPPPTDNPPSPSHNPPPPPKFEVVETPKLPIQEIDLNNIMKANYFDSKEEAIEFVKNNLVKKFTGKQLALKFNGEVVEKIPPDQQTSSNIEVKIVETPKPSVEKQDINLKSIMEANCYNSVDDAVAHVRNILETLRRKFPGKCLVLKHDDKVIEEIAFVEQDNSNVNVQLDVKKEERNTNVDASKQQGIVTSNEEVVIDIGDMVSENDYNTVMKEIKADQKYAGKTVIIQYYGETHGKIGPDGKYVDIENTDTVVSNIDASKSNVPPPPPRENRKSLIENIVGNAGQVKQIKDFVNKSGSNTNINLPPPPNNIPDIKVGEQFDISDVPPPPNTNSPTVVTKVPSKEEVLKILEVNTGETPILKNIGLVKEETKKEDVVKHNVGEEFVTKSGEKVIAFSYGSGKTPGELKPEDAITNETPEQKEERLKKLEETRTKNRERLSSMNQSSSNETLEKFKERELRKSMTVKQGDNTNQPPSNTNTPPTGGLPPVPPPRRVTEEMGNVGMFRNTEVDTTTRVPPTNNPPNVPPRNRPPNLPPPRVPSRDNTEDTSGGTGMRPGGQQ